MLVCRKWAQRASFEFVLAGVALVALGCSAPFDADEASGPPPFGSGTLPGAGNPNSPVPGGMGTQGAPGVGGATGSSGSETTNMNGLGVSAGQSASQPGGSMLSPAQGNAGAGGSGMAEPAMMGSAEGTDEGSMAPMDPPATDPPPVTPPPPVPPPVNPPVVNPPPPPAPVNADCSELFFCDGFEDVNVGASPNAALWQVIEQYSPREQSANVQVSSDNARSGSRSVRVVGQQSRNGMVARLPESRYFMRAWLQIDAAPLGPVFVGLGASENSETRLRIQGQSRATINTVGPGDAVRPNAANGGACPECVTLVPNEWFCAELFIDNAAQAATLWIDGVEAAEIINGDGGWPVQPATPAMFVGSMGLQGGQTGVWIDDVAAGPVRIGCD